MKPQDIDKIANLVVGSLAAAPGVGILGCGSVSSSQDYDPACTPNAPFQCGAGGFECGHMGLFTCGAAFDCTPTGTDMFICDQDRGFFCGEVFSCNPQGLFWPTATLPPR